MLGEEWVSKSHARVNRGCCTLVAAAPLEIKAHFMYSLFINMVGKRYQLVRGGRLYLFVSKKSWEDSPPPDSLKVPKIIFEQW